MNAFHRTHIQSLLAEFERSTGTGNMVRANKVMMKIIAGLLDLIDAKGTGPIHTAAQSANGARLLTGTTMLPVGSTLLLEAGADEFGDISDDRGLPETTFDEDAPQGRDLEGEALAALPIDVPEDASREPVEADAPAVEVDTPAEVSEPSEPATQADGNEPAKKPAAAKRKKD